MPTDKNIAAKRRASKDKRLERERKAQEELARMDQRIVRRASATADAILAVADFDFSDESGLTEPPPEWVTEYGDKEAWRRFRIAKMANMPGKDVPFGVKFAARIVTSSLTGNKDAAPKTLNVVSIALPNVHQMESPIDVYPRVSIDEKGKKNG